MLPHVRGVEQDGCWPFAHDVAAPSTETERIAPRNE
jgi:hypothetical protein